MAISTLNYWTHKNDFWSMVSSQDGCSQPIKDLWQSNTTHPQVRARLCVAWSPVHSFALSKPRKRCGEQGAPAFHLMGTQYEEYATLL